MKYIRGLVVIGILCCVPQVCFSEEIKTDYGGAECIDPEDCNNNGICKLDSETKKGKCYCVVGYAGLNCENEDKKAKEQLGTVVESKKSDRKKRNELEQTLKRDTRHFEYDSNSNVQGLTPESLADAAQAFLIYNPSSQKFLFVSYDKKVLNRNAYVEGRKDRLGERNRFLFERADGNKFYIKNVKQDKYVYMSNSRSGPAWNRNNNMLADDKPGPTATQDEKDKFMFEIVDENKDGFYVIKNAGKTAYLSSHYLGVPPNPLLKATDRKQLERWTSQYFQFSLRENAKISKFTVGEEKREEPLTLVDGDQSSKYCHAKEFTEPKAVSVSIKESSKETRTYSKTTGFTIGGEFVPPKVNIGKLTFTYKNDQTETDADENVKETTRTLTLNVKPDKCACITVTFSEVQYTRPYTLEVETKDMKTVKASGTVCGNRLSRFEAHTFEINNDGTKCPHEQ